MKKGKNRFNSGESLVEVLVGIFIFLMILAGLQSAVSFSSNAQRKSEEIRRKNTEICRSLHKAAYKAGSESKVLEFKAVLPDSGEGAASTPSPERPLLFKLHVNLGTAEAEYKEEDGSLGKVIFYLFGQDPSGGVITGLGGAVRVLPDGGGTEPGGTDVASGLFWKGGGSH